jgi:hypothetical protein
MVALDPTTATRVTPFRELPKNGFGHYFISLFLSAIILRFPSQVKSVRFYSRDWQ